MKPQTIYVSDLEFGTNKINGVEYVDAEYYAFTDRFMVNCQETLMKKMYDQHFYVTDERPESGIYYYYINFNQDLVEQLGMNRTFRDNLNGVVPLCIEDEKINQDIKSGRCLIILDHSLEGFPVKKYNKERLLYWLGPYIKNTILVTGDARKNASSIITTTYNNHWEMHVAAHSINSDKINYHRDRIIRDRILSKATRAHKGLMKNRIIRPHRVYLANAIHNDEFLSNHINYSFSLTTYHNMINTMGKEDFISHMAYDVKKATGMEPADTQKFLMSDPEFKLAEEPKIDFNVNQSGVYTRNLVEIHSNAFFQIVTETNYDSNTIFQSEKTFQPIMMMQPFVLVAEPGAVAFLRENGYDVFDDIIDHSYDTIYEHPVRMKAIMAEIRRLCVIGWDEWPEILFDLYPRLEMNLVNLHNSFHRHKDFLRRCH